MKGYNLILLLAVIYSIVFMALPPELKIIGYGPSILGWIWYIAVIYILFQFIRIGFSDYKKKDFKSLKKRMIHFSLIIVLHFISFFCGFSNIPFESGF